MDEGVAGNDKYFWAQVQEAFVRPNPLFDTLKFQDDDVFSGSEIDPGSIVQHDWKKLRVIWKAVNADYKAALSRYTTSGTHESNFYTFCVGKKEVYYLKKHLEQRPELNGMVEAALPREVALSSDNDNNNNSNNALSSHYNSDSSRDNRTKRTRREDKNKSQIAMALNNFANNQMKAELNKEKITCMRKEEARLEHTKMFSEWESVQQNIRLIRQDMKDPTLTEAAKRELESDIVGLTNRKNDLAFLLGLK